MLKVLLGCGQEHVGYSALDDWKLKIFRSLMGVCCFALIPLVFSQLGLDCLFSVWDKMSGRFVVCFGSGWWAADGVVVWRLCYIDTLVRELGGAGACGRISAGGGSVVDACSVDVAAKFAVSIREERDGLPALYWLPRLRGRPYRARFFANSSSCAAAVLSKLLTSCLAAVRGHWIRYVLWYCLREGRSWLSLVN